MQTIMIVQMQKKNYERDDVLDRERKRRKKGRRRDEDGGMGLQRAVVKPQGGKVWPRGG